VRDVLLYTGVNYRRPVRDVLLRTVVNLRLPVYNVLLRTGVDFTGVVTGLCDCSLSSQ
jgi:hypothetical protein